MRLREWGTNDRCRKRKERKLLEEGLCGARARWCAWLSPLADTSFASGTEAKAQFLTPPSTPSLKNLLMNFLSLVRYTTGLALIISLNTYLLFIFHLQQLVAFLIHPFLSHWVFGMERFWCTHTCMLIIAIFSFITFFFRLRSTHTQLLG